ncbi:MAG: ABC transporter permease [Phycisphaerae bacterium SM23_30]|nr:MAG: ABC transporter permease [Phycisphaerae bacterium SM23_30]
MIKDYPDFSELSLQQRPILHPLFQGLVEGISEFTFANLYLFRKAHQYRIARLGPELYVIAGKNADELFFMLPFGLPENDLLPRLFDDFTTIKAVSENQAAQLAEMGYTVEEDRDNFDYLYSREELTRLPGRKFHKKKNRVNAFIKNYQYQGEPLLEEYRDQALAILDAWVRQRDEPGDYEAAREALEKMWPLQLCGGIYYVDSEPVAYSLGEELARGKSFAIHFEKAIKADQYKGIYQFVNQAFASILPEKYDTINREQDLGDPGLRQAKEGYNPVGFVKKYRARS